MSRLDVQFLEQGFHRAVLDAVPLPVFVVDRDVTILDYNSAAAKILGTPRKKSLNRRAGDALHCLHSTETPGGCGHSNFCSDCVVRQAVNFAWKGKKAVRESTTMELVSHGKSRRVQVKISTNPFNFFTHTFVLLVLEGLDELSSPSALPLRLREGQDRSRRGV